MTITRSSIAKQLLPGLNAIFGLEYKSVDNEHTPLFDIETSNRNFEEEVLMTGFESAPTKAEGAAVTYDDAQETYSTRYVHETIALAFAITEEAMEDNLYDSFAKIRAKALARAMANTKQVKAANVFNNAFTATGGDGVALFSASHPTKSAGLQSNTDTTDLSETALENAIIAVSLFKDDRGILISAMAKSLHIPPQLLFTAKKILGSSMSTTTETNSTTGVTNTNKINYLNTGGFLPGGCHVNHRFTDTNAWFLRTDVPNGTKMFVRKKIARGFEGDFDTGNMRYKGRERYSFGYSNWRQWWGSSGSS